MPAIVVSFLGFAEFAIWAAIVRALPTGTAKRRQPGRAASESTYAKRKLTANELVLAMTVNQMRTPNVAMVAATRGFDATCIDLEQNPAVLETATGFCVAMSSNKVRRARLSAIGMGGVSGVDGCGVAPQRARII
jgi:hypothetical protein